MPMHRRALISTALLSTAVFLPMLAQAQPAFRDRPIKLVVSYAAGGLSDTVTRIFAQPVGDRLGQSVVVDNKPAEYGRAIFAESERLVKAVATAGIKQE